MIGPRTDPLRHLSRSHQLSVLQFWVENLCKAREFFSTLCAVSCERRAGLTWCKHRIPLSSEGRSGFQYCITQKRTTRLQLPRLLVDLVGLLDTTADLPGPGQARVILCAELS